MANPQTLEAMGKEQPVMCKTSELSQVTGIKKQTLRRYDRIGLLTHPADTAAIQRLYARDDLISIERLIFMQMLGLSRSQIKQSLKNQSLSFGLLPELQLQRQILLEKRRRLNRLIYFMEYAEQINRDPDSDDWHYLGNITQAIHWLGDPEGFKRYYLQREVANQEIR